VTRSRLAIIKVGGSLLGWPDLPARMAAVINARRADANSGRIALIAGGGRAADLVRELDGIHGFGDEPAHRLALHALDLTARILAEMLPDPLLIDSIETLQAAWGSGRVPVLVPRLILDEIERDATDRMPPSWDVTSDSIAARIAVHVGAERLVLLKSASLPAGASRELAARLGFVDPILPIVARTLPCVEYLNLRERTAQPQLLPP
jgi:aspartokinase-like uncharacterized kinase